MYLVFSCHYKGSIINMSLWPWGQGGGYFLLLKGAFWVGGGGGCLNILHLSAVCIHMRSLSDA